MSPHDLFSLLKQTYTEWSEDKAPRLAAALAFYTAFSLAPVLLIAIAIAGFFYADADEDARRQIAAIIPGGGDAITGLLDAANRSGRTGFAAIVGVVTLLFGASGFFGQLQDAMNTIWDVAPRPGQGFMATVRQRFLSFTMVLGTGFLLLVSLLVSVVLSTAMGYLGNLVPGVDALWGLVSYAMSLVMSTLIFAMIFKVVPDVEIAWRDVWLGAAVTAVLFMIGQALLNLYLASQETAYGVFGSLWLNRRCGSSRGCGSPSRMTTGLASHRFSVFSARRRQPLVRLARRHGCSGQRKPSVPLLAPVQRVRRDRAVSSQPRSEQGWRRSRHWAQRSSRSSTRPVSG